MGNNFFDVTVFKSEVTLTICFIQLIQVETKCWIDDGVRNEEFSLKYQHFNSSCNAKYLTASIDVFSEAVIIKVAAASMMR
jgi:hypothetical protein